LNSGSEGITTTITSQDQKLKVELLANNALILSTETLLITTTAIIKLVKENLS
jgi:hypothetical protein